MKARNFVGERSRWIFVTRSLMSSYCFRKDKLGRLECRIRSASIFGEPSEKLGNLADGIPFPKIFWGLNFELRTPNRSICVSLHKHAFKKL